MPTPHSKKRSKRSSPRPARKRVQSHPGDVNKGSLALAPAQDQLPQAPHQESLQVRGEVRKRTLLLPAISWHVQAPLIAIAVLLLVTLQGGVPSSIGEITPAGNAPAPSWVSLRQPALSTVELPGAVPSRVKALYYTSWSAGVSSRMEQAIALIHASDLNAVVIDLKDFSGKVTFETSSPLIKRIGSEEHRIGNLPQLVHHLHQEGIYVIGRIAVFQDQHLLKVRPDLALRNTSGAIWRDRRGLGWVDPASREVWEYVAEIAREAAKAGIDELNFDYVRFPSDGSLAAIRYPFYSEQKESRRQVIRNLFAFLAETLSSTGKVRSVDLFGLATIRRDDLGIGQVLEDALLYFDYVCPMVYPSHYARGFLQYRNPAAYPYEVIHYSLATAVAREARFAQMIAPIMRESTPEGTSGALPPAKLARMRPWLQAFDLGAVYSPAMIHKEMQAVYDAGLTSGWYLWNPANTYAPAMVEPRRDRVFTNTIGP